MMSGMKVKASLGLLAGVLFGALVGFFATPILSDGYGTDLVNWTAGGLITGGIAGMLIGISMDAWK